MSADKKKNEKSEYQLYSDMIGQFLSNFSDSEPYMQYFYQDIPPNFSFIIIWQYYFLN